VEPERPLPGLAVESVRTFDAPEAMGIRFHEVRAKSALNHVPGSRFGFNWTINLYRGCTHACSYCFARRTHLYLDLDAGRDFEREIVVKVNAPEVLRAELARRSWKRELVAIGTNTDPYQWVESRYRMMPEVIAALEEAETPISVLTKSPLLLRDIDRYERMAKHLPVSVNLSVPTLDEKVWRATEPHTPHPSARLDAVAELRRRGIDSGVLIAPLMPGINDAPEQVGPIVERAREAGATFLSGVALHLRDEVREVFFGWLGAKRPDLLPRYEELYANRRAYMKPADRNQVASVVNGWGRGRRRQAVRETAPADRRQPRLF
jgi:DNA repair photolyase